MQDQEMRRLELALSDATTAYSTAVTQLEAVRKVRSQSQIQYEEVAHRATAARQQYLAAQAALQSYRAAKNV